MENNQEETKGQSARDEVTQRITFSGESENMSPLRLRYDARRQTLTNSDKLSKENQFDFDQNNKDRRRFH